MLVIHHLDNSRSQRVLWLLEELALPYEVVLHTRPADRSQPVASLCKLHPLGKAPVLTDGEVVIAETGAIFEYIMDQYAQQRMQPKHGTHERVLYIHWRHFSEGSLMPYLAMKLVFSAMVKKSPWFARPIVGMIAKAVGEMYLNPNIRAELSYINRHLAEHVWFAGTEFSAADVLIGFQLEAVFERMATRQDYPHLANFVDRIRERPAYKAAMLKGAWSVEHHHQYWACLKQ